MCDPSADELLTKLAFSLCQYERSIRNGESKLCLTGNSLVFLDKCFLHAAHVDLTKLGAERVYSKSSQSSVDFLSNLTKEAISLKIVPGPSQRLDILLSISHFQGLQFLEIKKIPLGYITGLQSLRRQLKGLTCSRSVFALSEVFVCCGGDLSSTPFAWERLQEVNLSYNSINSFDDSLTVLPALEVLNLSHNNIVSPDEDDDWQSLLELKHINLGYNQLDKVPCASTLKHSLKTLILRNNNIQNLKGIEHFKLLEVLDVSNNCITSFQELFPLAHLEMLLCLQLAGNPVCYCDGYRVRAVSYMSPFPRRGDVFLDKKKLSPFEKTFVGISVDPVSPLAYLSADVSNEVIVDSSQGMTDQNLPTQGTKKKKVKKVKPRNVAIISDVEDVTAYSSSVVSSQELSLDHSQDIERLEKARNLGGEHWLPAINQVLHGGELSEQQRTNDEKLETILSTSPNFVSHENVNVDVNPSPIKRKTSIASLHSDDEQVVAGVIQPFIVTLKTMDPTSDSHEEEREEHDLLVTVTDHYIRERDFKNGKVVCKLETESLLSANIEQSEDGEIVVHLKFDYMSRERKERLYVMDGRESCEQFIEALHPLMKSNEISKNSNVTEHLQCLKCSAHFTENANKTSDHICPDCGSTKIIEILSPDEPVKTRNVDRSNEVQTTLPDLISSVSPNTGKQMDHPDLYVSSRGYDKHQPGNELDVFRVTEKSLDGSMSSVSSTANTESPVIKQETKKTYTITQTTGFVVNNASKFVVNKQAVAKTSSPLRTSVLSNSLMSLEVTNSDMEQNQVNPKPKTVTLQKRVIDSPISLKTSSQKASNDYYEASQQSGDDLDGIVVQSSVEKTVHQRKISNNLTKVSSSPAPRVFRNLFNKLGNKMSGSGTSGSSDEQESTKSKTPKIGGNLFDDISPDEFKECDHRLQLYFEVSLFKGRKKEFLICLIKAPVVVYGDIKESSSLLVVSNIAIYILKLEETSGLSTSECLSVLGSYSLKDIQFVDLGLGFHSFRIELSGDLPGSFTFLVRDTERCKVFTDLLLEYVNKYKDENGFAQVVTTARNLQTLAHIRACVFGMQQENVHTMGERFLQQVTLFADPSLVKDRKSLLRHYSSCFIGKDLVDWMIRNGEARTRTEAVETVQRLVNAGLIEHVSKECKFEDKEQFYRFCIDQNEEGKEKKKDTQDYQDEFYDTDLNISTAAMAFRLIQPIGEGMDVKPVTIIISNTHICVVEENYKWPLPRYLDVPTPNDPQFHCVEKHKMTDVTGLEFFEDKPCHVGILISEEDAPLECAENYLLIKTETKSSIESLVNAIKIPWEGQFGVELQISTFPYLKK